MRRRGDFTTTLEQLRLRGAADDLDLKRTVDVLSLLTSPESSDHLVLVYGWSRVRGAWFTDVAPREPLQAGSCPAGGQRRHPCPHPPHWPTLLPRTPSRR